MKYLTPILISETFMNGSCSSMTEATRSLSAGELWHNLFSGLYGSSRKIWDSWNERTFFLFSDLQVSRTKTANLTTRIVSREGTGYISYCLLEGLAPVVDQRWHYWHEQENNARNCILLLEIEIHFQSLDPIFLVVKLPSVGRIQRAICPRGGGLSKGDSGTSRMYLIFRDCWSIS